jgi:hypothetical protein
MSLQSCRDDVAAERVERFMHSSIDTHGVKVNKRLLQRVDQVVSGNFKRDLHEQIQRM